MAIYGFEWPIHLFKYSLFILNDHSFKWKWKWKNTTNTTTDFNDESVVCMNQCNLPFEPAN